MDAFGVPVQATGKGKPCTEESRSPCRVVSVGVGGSGARAALRRVLGCHDPVTAPRREERWLVAFGEVARCVVCATCVMYLTSERSRLACVRCYFR